MPYRFHPFLIGGEPFHKFFNETCKNLKKLMGVPKEFSIFFTASSLENMERIIQNLVKKTSFHIVTGEFGKKWLEIATQLGKTPEHIATSDGEGFDFGTLKVPKDSEIICITQNETSTGILIPMEEISFLKN